MAFWLVDFVRIDYCSEIIAVVVKRKKKESLEVSEES